MTGVMVVAKPQPFGGDTVCAKFAAGQTLAQMLGPDVSDTARVSVGGYLVPRDLWAHVKPKPLSTVHVVLFPQGGNGGKWLRSVLMIALIAATYGVGAYAGLAAGAAGAFGGSAAIWGAAILAVGSLAITPMVGDAREIPA